MLFVFLSAEFFCFECIFIEKITFKEKKDLSTTLFYVKIDTYLINGLLAQLVEQLTLNQWV